MRRRFMRRIGSLFLLFFGLTLAASAAIVALLSRAFGLRGGFGTVAAAAVLGVFLLAAVVVVGRLVRRTAAPIGDVMEAAHRVAEGDYSVRVRAHGPAEVRGLAAAFNEMAERLEGNEANRRTLFADLAHELRTPLMVIQSRAEAVRDGLYPADEAHLGAIVDQTQVMARLLDDLQTLSMADAGMLRLHPEPTEPSTLVEDAVDAFRASAEAARVSLRSDVQEGLAILYVDAVRIGQVLGNLMTNALRHTAAGGAVTISVVRTQDGVVFTVADTGEGMSADQLANVFDRFTSSRGSGGVGLGLAIAKGLVEAHGGSIDAASEPGRGTRIAFTLPVAR